VLLPAPEECCVCGHLTPRGVVYGDLGDGETGRLDRLLVGWCDTDWQRWVVRHRRKVAARLWQTG